MQEVDTAVLMQEAKFELTELFFSITKHDSTILSGNDTFVRISGYERDEIIGQFHNIIRHQDMPRVIFKVFWDYLKANKPIVAYVKNKTKEGAYYWVFAVVFPLGEEYISIRIKPTTPIFTAVRELYFRLLMAESKMQMQESEELLFDLLNELGYRDYDHFMSEVLLAELVERRKLLASHKGGGEKEGHPHIKPLYEVSKKLFFGYSKWFEKIESFVNIKCQFEEKGYMLRTLARDIVLLSLNASVASYKLEANGETFGVLASDIRTNAKENDVLIGKIDRIAQHLSETLNELIFMVSYVSLQMEMVTYFVKEMCEKNNPVLDNSVNTLYSLVSMYNTKLEELPIQLQKAVTDSIAYLDELDQQVMYLGYVQIYGIIESARCTDDKLGFNEIFSQLKTLINKTLNEIVSMKKMTESFFTDNEMLLKELKQTDIMLQRFANEITIIKRMD